MQDQDAHPCAVRPVRQLEADAAATHGVSVAIRQTQPNALHQGWVGAMVWMLGPKRAQQNSMQNAAQQGKRAAQVPAYLQLRLCRAPQAVAILALDAVVGCGRRRSKKCSR